MDKDTNKTVSVRYIVNDVSACMAFYQKLLGFEISFDRSPAFAMLTKGPFRLLLNKPGAGGAGQSMPDGAAPEPGGWNRFQLEVEDLESTVAALKKQNATFRNEIVHGIGGDQILLQDPSGNLIELFQAKQ